MVIVGEKTGAINTIIGQTKCCYLYIESKSMKYITLWCNNTLNSIIFKSFKTKNYGFPL